MADPRRLESPSPEAADRDSRAEALLVEGLDQYFAGRYDDAIHLWTRVLFLDRSHARARAYIDRARTAMAERQRRADEMLQASRELMSEGNTAAARELLTRAAATTGDDDRVAETRARLERVERAMRGATDAARVAVVDAVPVRREASRVIRLRRLRVAAGAVVLATVGVLMARQWFVVESQAPPLPVVERVEPPAVPSRGEVALLRARTLYGRGRLADALRALEGVEGEGDDRVEADRLKTTIQQMLLATGHGAASPIEVERGRP